LEREILTSPGLLPRNAAAQLVMGFGFSASIPRSRTACATAFLEYLPIWANWCGHALGVDFEKPAQPQARFAAAKPFRAQRVQPARRPGRDLLGDGANVVAGGDEWTFHSPDRFFVIPLARRLVGMQHVPAFGRLQIAAQFGVAGHAPNLETP
jgi:hypothetical protein